MEEATKNTEQGLGRFTKHMIIGAVISGVLCAIPIVSCVNIFFCILNMGGVVFALSMYLKAFPDDTLTNGDALGFGAIAGAGGGLISGILGMIFNLVFGTMLAALLAKIPGSDVGGGMLTSQAISGIMGILMLPVFMILYGAFGLLGAFLGMKIFFKSRIRNA